MCSKCLDENTESGEWFKLLCVDTSDGWGSWDGGQWWQHYEIMMFREDVELSENGVVEVATVQMAFLGGQLQEHILILYGQGLYAGHLRCSKYMG